MTSLGDTDGHEDVIRIPVTLEHAPANRPLPDHVIRTDEPLADGIQRVIVGQYDRMLAAFDTPPDGVELAVHTVRKAQKRTRALLRLIRSQLPPDTYATENRTLRDSARILSPVRDSHVQVITLDALADRFGDIAAPGVFEDASTWVRAVRRRSESALLTDRMGIERLRSTLEAGRERWDGADAMLDGDSRPIRDSFGSIEHGLHRAYRKGRRAHRAAITAPSIESLHRWRKSVKYLRYQLESLTALWPDLIEAHVDRLDTLGEVLGDEHDLAVLDGAITGLPGASSASDTQWLLGSLVERRRRELIDEAMILGSSLYSEQPTAFVDRMRGYWVAARGPSAALRRR